MAKKIILAIVVIAVVAFLSISVYKAWFEKTPCVVVENDDEEEEERDNSGSGQEVVVPPLPPDNTGQIQYVTCDACGGTGKCLKCIDGMIGDLPCASCFGYGTCQKCGGLKYLPSTTTTTP